MMARRARNDITRTLTGSCGVAWTFTVAAFALMLVPSVGLLWAPGNEGAVGAEKRELAPPPPVLTAEGAPNVDVLADAGEWFEDHFAYRAALVDAGARLYAGAFGVSTTDQVIVGRQGWLYYGGTLADFQDRAPLRSRQARNIAHNLRLMQDYCEAQGARFAVMAAPDKNALYPEAMPYYYPPVPGSSEERLAQRLAEFGVRFVDASGALRQAMGSEGLLYYQGDSHWNEKGALVAQDALVEAVGLAKAPFDATAMEERHDYVGDLERMLYPLSAAPEEDWALAGVNDGSGANGAPRSGSRWRFVEGEGVEDGLVCTEPAEGLTAGGAEGAGEGAREAVAGGAVAEANGTLLMFRDSFGNSLVPYLACEFQRAGFSKMLPYDLLSVREERPSVVVVERTQRHEAYWAEEAPLMPCPRVEVQAAGREPMAVEATATVDGPLLRLKGRVAGLAARWPEADVFVRLEGADGQGATYEAFALSDGGSDDGFCLSVSAEAWSRRATRAVVLVGEPGAAVAVGEMPLDAGALAS